jgi:glycogen operon protein
MTGRLATRLCGSADLYERNGEQPVNGVNFVTCHDGFTLADLVSFSRSHNEPNGHGNQDGADENYSANHGIEGPTEDLGIGTLRLRQSKNMLATLLLSRGVPMILGGDEFHRSQRGNNNAYCQDNEVSWYDWNLVEQNAELVRFVRGMIALRGRHPVLSAERFYNDAEIRWFAPSGERPDWDGAPNTLGCVIREPSDGPEDACALLCLLFNADAEAVRFTIPVALAPRRWRIVVDTAKAPPWDIAELGVEAELKSEHCRLEAHSAVVLGSLPE